MSLSNGLCATTDFSARERGRTSGAQQGQTDRQPYSRCSALIMLQQAAKRLVADNVIQPECFQWLGWRQGNGDGDIAKTLVRTDLVIVRQPAIQDVPQVALA